MAGAGYKLFVNGNTLSASDLNTYIQQQTVMVFANTGARDTALTGVVAEGMHCYIIGTGRQYYNGSAWITDVTASSTSTLTNKTLTSPVENNPYITSPKELTTISATASTGTINFDLLTQGVLYYTTSAAANFTLNLRGNSGTTLNSLMNTNDAWSVVFLNTNGATPYYLTAITIDGNSPTIKWTGGTAPTAGNASAIDAYSFIIMKTASGVFTVLGSQVKFA